MDVRAIREALERGLDKEHLKKASDAMECMTTHRWYWRWAQDLESNCKDALAALSSVDPDAIRAEARAEALSEAKGAIKNDLDTFRACGRKDVKGHLRAIMLIDEIIADEQKEREAEETDIDFVEPTSRDMQIADEVRMCKLGVGAAMRVAKYRIEVERKLKEAEV